MSAEFSSEPKTERQRLTGWRGFLAQLGIGSVEDGVEEQVPEPKPGTAMYFLAELERKEAEQTPPGFPEPYKIGIQEYPGNALWRGVNTPEEAATVLRALGKLDPPHVLAERDGQDTTGCY